MWRFPDFPGDFLPVHPPTILTGAFSAMRYHYQAAVINLAKDAVVSSKASTPLTRPGSIEEAEGGWARTVLTHDAQELEGH